MNETQHARVVTHRRTATWDVPAPSPEPAPVTLRPARDTDAADLTAMLASLSVQSGFHRFLTGLGRPSQALVSRLLRRDDQHGAWLAIDHRWFVVGHVQWAVQEGVVDLGVVVADSWQGRGIGRRLLQAAMAEAAVAGARTVQVDVHHENRQVLRLLRSALPRAAASSDGALLTFRAPLADALGSVALS